MREITNTDVGVMVMVGLFLFLIIAAFKGQAKNQVILEQEYQAKLKRGAIDCLQYKDDLGPDHVKNYQEVHFWPIESITSTISEEVEKSPIKGSMSGFFIIIGGASGRVNGGEIKTVQYVYVNRRDPMGLNIQKLPLKDVYINIEKGSRPNMVKVVHQAGFIRCPFDNTVRYRITIPDEGMVYRETKSDMWKKAIGNENG